MSLHLLYAALCAAQQTGNHRENLQFNLYEIREVVLFAYCTWSVKLFWSDFCHRTYEITIYEGHFPLVPVWNEMYICFKLILDFSTLSLFSECSMRCVQWSAIASTRPNVIRFPNWNEKREKTNGGHLSPSTVFYNALYRCLLHDKWQWCQSDPGALRIERGKWGRGWVEMGTLIWSCLLLVPYLPPHLSPPCVLLQISRFSLNYRHASRPGLVAPYPSLVTFSLGDRNLQLCSFNSDVPLPQVNARGRERKQ